MRKLLLPLLLLTLVLTGCGTDDTTDTTDTAATTSPVATAADDEAALVDAFDDVVTACQDQDRDRLQDRVVDDLGDQLRERDRDRLFGTGDAQIDLIHRTVEIEGDTATVTAVFEVTIDGETTEVERVWEFERTDDGTWVLTEIPECPFRS